MPLKLCGISGMRGAFSGEVASTGPYQQDIFGATIRREGGFALF
jgi:hypothetical protein